LDRQTRWFEGAGVRAEGEAGPVPLYDQIIGVFNGHALKRAEVLAHFKDISADTIDRYLKKAAAVGDLIPGKEGRAITYRKPGKPDSPHNPQPYRVAEHADNQQGIENAKDSHDFEWPEDFDRGDHADHSVGTDEDRYLDAIER
jgi:hypothetical protein